MAKQLLIGNMDTSTMNTGIPKGGIANIFGGAKQVNVHNVATAEPFVSLFAINDDVLNSIVDSMNNNGYDKNQPIIIWQEKDILIDGHTRLQASKLAGIDNIPAFYASFKSDDEVLDYMYSIQFNRRNITDSELIAVISRVLSQYVKKYGEGNKTDFIVQRLCGIGKTKAKQAIFIIENCDKTTNKVINNEISIKQAYLFLQNSKNGHGDQIEKDKNSPNKYDSTMFEDDGNKQLVRSDDDGIFYYRNYESKKEYRVFELPSNMNTPRIRSRIQQVLDEELGGSNG